MAAKNAKYSKFGKGLFTTKDTKSTKLEIEISETFVSFVPSW